MVYTYTINYIRKKLFIIPSIFYNISINQSINQPIKYNHDNSISFNSFNITLEYVNNLNTFYIHYLYKIIPRDQRDWNSNE